MFSGIGGFSLGLERAGMETVAFCEIDPFCQGILRQHWPDVPIYNDVTMLKGADIGKVEVICGGFPCQDISTSGKQKGIEAARSGLWAEYHRLIGEIQPQYAIVENVRNLLAGEGGLWFAQVLQDLAEVRYDAEWHCIPAAYVGAPHVRDRVWIVAYPSSRRTSALATAVIQGSEEGRLAIPNGWASTEPFRYSDRQGLFCLGDSGNDGEYDGIPGELDRIKALGNAVVPQVAELLGGALIAWDKQYTSGKAVCL